MVKSELEFGKQHHCRLLTFCLAVIVLTLITSLFVPVVVGFDVVVSRQDVIIGFMDIPDVQLLLDYNVVVLETFSIIPAVHALVPQGSVGLLEQNPSISYITENSEAYVAAIDINWPLQSIEVTENVWMESTGAGVKIALLDTGIAPVNGLSFDVGYNFVNNNVDVMDKNGHGTMIASIIAAQHDSSSGLKGVAPDAQIYAVKVLNDQGSGTVNQIILGIQWAINNGMQIVSMSLGSNTTNRALGQAVDSAYNAGLLVVAAAGNSGETRNTDVNYPAKYDSVIAVAAAKEDNSRLEASSFGPEVELAAPGANIYAIRPNNIIYSASGTSFSVPYVVGTAALIWAKNENLTNIEIRDILRQTATNLQPNNNDEADRDIYFGYGLINTTAALQKTLPNNNNTPTNTLDTQEETPTETPTEAPTLYTSPNTSSNNRQQPTFNTQQSTNPPIKDTQQSTDQPPITNNNQQTTSPTPETNPIDIINIIIIADIILIINTIIISFSAVRYKKCKK